MVVVKRQDKRPWPRFDVIDQGSEKTLRRHLRGGLRYLAGDLADSGINGSQGGQQIGEETSRITVAFIEAQPGDI